MYNFAAFCVQGHFNYFLVMYFSCTPNFLLLSALHIHLLRDRAAHAEYLFFEIIQKSDFLTFKSARILKNPIGSIYCPLCNLSSSADSYLEALRLMCVFLGSAKFYLKSIIQKYDKIFIYYPVIETNGDFWDIFQGFCPTQSFQSPLCKYL